MSRLRHLISFGPAARDHYPAARIAVGVALPLLTVVALGRMDLTVFAVFGAFTGIYGRGEPLRRRVRHQGLAALLLLGCLALGHAFGGSGAGLAVVVVVAAAVATTGSLVVARAGARPGGAVFFVFAFTAVALIPDQPVWWQALGTSAASALVCLVSSVVGASHGREVLHGQVHQRATREMLVWHGIRCSAAIIVAGSIGAVSGRGHSYWAMVAAAAAVAAPTRRDQVVRAGQRVVGTLLGVAVSAVLLALPLGTWGTVGLVIVLQFLAEMYVTRNYAFALLFITPLALLMTQLAHPVPAGELLLDRAIETIIGSVAALAAVVVLRSRRGYDRDRPARW